MLTVCLYNITMADNGEDGIEEKAVDKHDWGAADLERVTNYEEEKDEMGTENVDHLKAQTPNVVSLHAEDIALLVKEFELKRPYAEKILIEARGDLKACVENFINA
ncbi:unnamed protein product [Bursaphelenchus xylophilus]|uniref:(pine wood nematode) hypothetical protein n=1 Tax=Bursaphelenchus xylophilus TaxID=6326 RepID=A0A1I7SDP2_BURXY|nr:unnamed protein product [Bursaphelenchus xylophilus]CAG9084479.1 unnamed protein product [Bursaphelenchus xylophilus]